MKNYPRKGHTREHRLICQETIGHDRQFVTHHVDDARGNNARANLVILENQTEHMSLHYRRAVGS